MAMIDPLALRCRVALHMARPGAELEHETQCATQYLKAIQHPFAHWLEHGDVPVTLDDLVFVEIDGETAQVFHERFHYIGSYRPGYHFALKHKRTRRIACMGSIANFDLNHAKEKLPLLKVLVYSRFFAFRWAPKNCFSHFWGKLRQYLIKEFGTELMFSYINPNLGFNGNCHKAAQWVIFGHEEAEYMYLNGVYRTRRFFMDEYGTTVVNELKEKLGEAFQVSEGLQPLLLLANPLHKNAQSVIPTTPYVFKRPIL